MTYSSLVSLLVSLAFIGGLLYVLRKTFARRGRISRSLNLKLLSVRFTKQEERADTSVAQIREKIALMETFYVSLHTLRDSWLRSLLYGRPVFALELAVSSGSEELAFYVAVPRRLTGAVEKVIQGIFPQASVEEVDDYTIFNKSGHVHAAPVMMKKGPYLPFRTYQTLEGDPLRELANVFTKLAREGEGAALQIIARPARGKWKARLKKHAHMLFEGKKPLASPALQAIQSGVDAVGGSASSQKNDQQANSPPPPPKRLMPLEEEVIRTIEKKASKALFETNVRLLVSAPSEARAQEILHGQSAAFAQFADQNINSLRVAKLRRGGIKRLAFLFSFRSFDERRIMVLDTEELTSLFHFPNVALEAPRVHEVRAQEASPPVNLPEDGLLLGYNTFRGQNSDIRLLDEDRRRHLYVIGQTGTGKSVFLKNMIVQDIQDGKGVCFIDPHGDGVEDVLAFVPPHRYKDVVYFDPGDTARPMGLNMLEFDPSFPEQKTFIVNEFLSIFDKLFNMSVAGGPMFEQYFRNATMLVMEDPSSGNTILEIERVLADASFREMKLSRSKNIVVNKFWTEVAGKAGGEASLANIVPYITSKIDNFVANEIMRPIVAQEKSAINFREVMDNQKILLVNLSKGRLGDLNSSFIGLILVGKLLMAALSRVNLPEAQRKDFYLYIDEFQNVTTDSIATILSEARKYRLDLTITHQFIGQLKEEIKKAVFGNVGSMVSFRIGSDDAEFMARQFQPTFSEKDLLNIDNWNCYVNLLIRGQTTAPFNMKTYPLEGGDPAAAETIKELARTKFGRPREDIEAEIQKNFMPTAAG